MGPIRGQALVCTLVGVALAFDGHGAVICDNISNGFAFAGKSAVKCKAIVGVVVDHGTMTIKRQCHLNQCADKGLPPGSAP